MPRRLPNRYGRRGHRRVGERARSDADMVRACLRIPEYRGTAVGTEMKLDFAPRVAGTHVDLARPLDVHLLLREKGDDAEGRAGLPLARHAMTDAHTRG